MTFKDTIIIANQEGVKVIQGIYGTNPFIGRTKPNSHVGYPVQTPFKNTMHFKDTIIIANQEGVKVIQWNYRNSIK